MTRLRMVFSVCLFYYPLPLRFMNNENYNQKE